MDYISIGMIVVVVLAMIIGFFQGGLRNLIHFLLFVGAAAIAYFTFKYLASFMIGKGLDTKFAETIQGWIANSVAYEYGGQTFTGDTVVAKSYLEMADVRNAIYQNANISEAIATRFDALVVSALSSISADQVALAYPFALALAGIAVDGVAFLSIFLACLILFLIAFYVVCGIIRRKTGGKKGAVSRIFGTLMGLVTGLAIVYVACVVLHLLISFDSSVGQSIRAMIHYDDDTFDLTKWLMNLPLGYDKVVNFIMGLIPQA